MTWAARIRHAPGTPAPTPLAEDLLVEVRKTAASAATIKPFTKTKAKRAFGPEPDEDALAVRLADRRRPEPEDEP